MKRSILFCVGVAIAIPMFFVSDAASGEDVIFDNVAGPDVEAPEGGYFDYLYSGSLDVGRTVFQATTWSPWVDGIWADESGQIETIADTETLVPGSVIHFSGFDGHAQDAGSTVFFGQYPEWCDIGSCGGMYLAAADGMSKIADTNDTVPDRNVTFEYLGEPAIDEDTVAFRGGTVIDSYYRYGIYAEIEGQLVTAADWETPTPYGTGYLDLYDVYEGSVGVYEGEVFFHASNTGTWTDGFYAWDPATDLYRVLRDGNTVVPGTQSFFDWTWGDVYRNGTYAFVGHYWTDTDEESIFADFGDGLTEIVSADTIEAEWFVEDIDFQTVSVNGEMIAFTAVDYWSYNNNRLFLYRHSDQSLRSIIGTGDVLNGRVVNWVTLSHHGASDDSVAFIVEFRDNYSHELFVAYLHTPRHDLLAGPDSDGNGYGDLILLRQQTDDRSYLLQVRDSFTGGMPLMIDLGDFPVYDIALVENPGWAPEIAVFSKKHNGRVIVKFYSLTTGAFLRTHKLWLDVKPVALTVVPDMNGNGLVEIAAMVETAQPFIRVKILDTVTGEELNVIQHGKTLRPVSLYVTEDLNASGMPEIVILGVVRSTEKVRVIVQDAADDTVLADFFAGFNDKAPVLDAMIFADLSGNDVPEILLARERPAAGKANYEARDLLSGEIVVDKSWVTDSRPVKLTTVEDLTGDSMADVGLLMVEPAGDTQVRIHDLVTNSLVDSMAMDAVENGWNLITTPDIDASQTEELVALGEHFGADMLELRDCADGEPLRYYFVP